tara:strand:+ start:2203 stop:2448 length:246 start_codon:yes stop_codon:yes gene_type:complete
MMNGGGMTPKPVADMTLQYFNPKHHTIVDMIMIQLISAIIVGLVILVYKGDDISQTDASLFMVGIFSAFILLTTVYSRITR